MIANKFGIFDHIENIPGTPTSRLFDDRLTLIKMADEAGFAGYHLAEHHGGELCMAPSQEIFIAAASRVTENIRFGPMVKLLPMHHPVRIIEDMCVIDQLTEGRLEFGVGRGAVPIEHYWYSHEWSESRDRFADTLASSIARSRRARSRARTAVSTTSRPMPMSIKPYQDTIPFWYPGSPQTAGRHGMSLMWPGKIDEAAYELYLETWHDHKGESMRFDGPDASLGSATACCSRSPRPSRRPRTWLGAGWKVSSAGPRHAHRLDHLKVSEDECYAAQGPLRAIHANMDIAIQFGAGTPGQIAERVAALLDDGMADYICFMMPTGDMTFDEAKRTLELFITEVQPQLESPAATHG